MQELSAGGQEHLGILLPHDGAGHRPRLDEPQREGGRGLGGAEAAVQNDDVVMIEAASVQVANEPGDDA